MKLNRLTPWLPDSVVKEIDRRLALIPNATILEFGMGVSTLYYVNRPGVRKVYSVEHDPEWFSQVLESVHAENSHKLCAKLYSLPYAKIASTVLKNTRDPFHMILIDGRNRSGCMRIAPDLLKPGGFIVLDNSERDEYKPAIQRLRAKGFLEEIHQQIYPDQWGFTYPGWTTSIFSRC